MARVTVEDCILQIPNRFNLVLAAARRARDIASGAALTLERDRDKNPVVALREIAEKTLSIEVLEEELIKAHQRIVLREIPEEETVELMAGEKGWAAAQNEDAMANMFVDESEDANGKDGDDEDDGDDSDDAPAEDNAADKDA